ncbi:Dihydroorotate dehydrogenase B (NAD(+)), electron transfer subunit [Austwickia sp. TVS 96-490-7B]|uniref:ferredoxin reductase family protein n=1 Tax=Austwickia sp. TVS 96-490-7B TaxID=2830843 RepID=UPI001C5820D4|nr:ferredoxin reductase family protein [Austwickia sp. TVS 96-490-7B]MBW3084464.1 Dihydroorotate dehydrogenase B (NAD(+)), electron transfer subunit [Austwickia sp. TVS 96-490-7B]
MTSVFDRTAVDRGSGGKLPWPLRHVGGARTRTGRPPAIRRWWAPLFLMWAWAGLLVVLAMWVRGGALLEMGSLTTVVTSGGRLAGLVAAYLLLIQVVLMARLPWLEQAVGQDRLAVIHGWVGGISLAGMVGHVGLILLGYAGLKVADLPGITWQVVTDMPAMVLATMGTAALVVVGVSSLRPVRRRLRYESWHLLHLYAYLGCFLALPHQVWTGKNFLAAPWVTAYWWLSWAGAVVLLVWYRVVIPLWRSLRHRVVVTGVDLSPGGVVTVTMTGRALDRLGAAGGQFFWWRFLDGPGWTRAHPFSLSAAPDGCQLQISVAMVGAGTARLARLKVGTSVLIEGPYGRFHEGVRCRRKVLLLASGIGAAPIKALVESMALAPGDAIVVHRVSDVVTAPLSRELAAAGASRGAEVRTIAGPRIRGRRSWLPQSWEHVRDDEALRSICPDLHDRELFICGGAGWTRAVVRAAMATGVPRSRIHAECFSS